MRTALIVSAILLVMSPAAFAQHANEVLGGKITPDKPTTAPTTKKPVAKATSNRSAPLYSPCGVYYKNRADMTAESNLGDKWYSLGQSANKHFWYNPHKTVCDAKTSVLNTWIKEEHKNTDGDYALVLYEMKCRSDQLRVKTVIEYDKNGNLLETNNEQDQKWQNVAPNTAGESMMKTVCRRP
jgi:hypothetical protein